MSDVQPMLYIEDLGRGIAICRGQLGFDVTVFGHHKDTGAPLIAGAARFLAWPYALVDTT